MSGDFDFLSAGSNFAFEGNGETCFDFVLPVTDNTINNAIFDLEEVDFAAFDGALGNNAVSFDINTFEIESKRSTDTAGGNLINGDTELNCAVSFKCLRELDRESKFVFCGNCKCKCKSRNEKNSENYRNNSFHFNFPFVI